MTMKNIPDKFVDTSIRRGKRKLATSEKESITQKPTKKKLIGDAQKAL